MKCPNHLSCSAEWPDVGYELKSPINDVDGKIINVNKDLWHLAVADIYVFNESKCNVGYMFKAYWNMVLEL